MTDDDLAAIRARWAAAAPGPWFDTDQPDGTLRVSFLPLVTGGEVPVHAPADWGAYAVCVVFPGDMEEYEGEDLRNARAIAAAPTDVAALLAHIDTLTAALAFDPYPASVFTELTTDEHNAILFAIRGTGVRNALERCHASWARGVLAARRGEE